MNTSVAAKYFDRYDQFIGEAYPEFGDGPIPSESYISPEYFELEREKIFRKSWIKVGHESMIPKVGDYFVKDIPVLKSSIIIARGPDGVIRGFHNACTHRGNELEAKCAQGNKTVFVCGFHSWSFDLKGNLRGLPDRDRFVKLDQSTRGLIPVSVECWKGFIFLNPSEKPDKNLVEYLGTMARDLDPYPFERLNLVGVWSAEVKANWKVLVDAFQEAYHVSTVHAKVQPTFFKVARTGQNRISGFRKHGPHRSMAGSKNPDWVPSPVEARALQLGGASFMQGLEPGQMLWPGINLGHEPPEAWAFDMNVVFPTSSLATAQGLVFAYEFYPIAVDQTRFEASMYMTKPATWSERIGQEFIMVQLREALREDLRSFESVQRGLMSGVIKDIFPSDQEIAIRHQHHVVDAMVRG